MKQNSLQLLVQLFVDITDNATLSGNANSLSEKKKSSASQQQQLPKNDTDLRVLQSYMVVLLGCLCREMATRRIICDLCELFAFSFFFSSFDFFFSIVPPSNDGASPLLPLARLLGWFVSN